MRFSRAAGWCFAGLLLATGNACMSNTPATSTPSSNAAGVLPCEDAVGSSPAPPSGYSTVFDRVALPTGKALQAFPSGESDPAAKLFAKDGLLIRRNVTFDVIVPGEWTGRLTIGWGSPAKRTNHLRVPGCRPTETINPLRDSDPWVAYAGGYWVSQPACIQLIVRTVQGDQTVQIGVGAACPGQSPPPSP